jgi:hypothetical protein
MLKQLCVIIGTKKGATSSLYEYMRQNPAIVGGFIKEPNFFGNVKKWERGIQWYKDQFIGYDEDKHIYGLDATTDYTQDGFLDVPMRMKNSGFEFKFIYILRDPFDKIESQTHQFLIDGDSIRPIYECLDTRILESTKYFKQLAKYLEYFSKDQFLLVDFDRIKNETKIVLDEINRFLDLPEFQYDTSYIHNLKSSAIGQSNKGYRNLRGILRYLKVTPFIPQIVKDKVRGILGKVSLHKLQLSDYTLSERQKAYLADYLSDDLKNLEINFGFKNEHWKIYSYENRKK